MKNLIFTLSLIVFSGLCQNAIANVLPEKPLPRASMFASSAQCHLFVMSLADKLPVKSSNMTAYTWFGKFSLPITSSILIGKYRYIDTNSLGEPTQGACGLFIKKSAQSSKFKQSVLDILNAQINLYNTTGNINTEVPSSYGLQCPLDIGSSLNNCKLIPILNNF